MTSNFTFLVEHSPLLADLGATAEKLYPFDPASCVLKLRLLAESLTQEIAVPHWLALAATHPGRTSARGRPAPGHWTPGAPDVSSAAPTGATRPLTKPTTALATVRAWKR